MEGKVVQVSSISSWADSTYFVFPSLPPSLPPYLHRFRREVRLRRPRRQIGRVEERGLRKEGRSQSDPRAALGLPKLRP